MSEYVENLHRYSEMFLPPFAVVHPVLSGGPPRRHPQLDFTHDEIGPLPAAGESVRGRWLTLSSCMITVTEVGTPVGVDALWQSQLMKLFDGTCDMTVTDRRLLLYVVDGSTPLGDMGPQTNRVLIAAYPLDRVDCVNVQVKEGPRGPKEQRLTIMSSRNGVAVIAVDHIEMVWTAGGFRPFRGSRVDLLDAMVAPVATARRAAATGPELAHLDAVLAGARTHTGDALSVTFITDKPLPYPPVASDAQLHVPLTPTTAPSAAGSRSCTHVECPAREVPTDAGSCPTCGRTTHHIAVHRGDEPMEMGPQPTRQESIDEPADFPQRTDIDVSPADSSRFCTRVGCAQRGTRTAALRCESCELPTSPISGKRSWTTAADHTQAQRSDTNVQQRPQPNSPTPVASQPRQPTPLGKDGSRFCIRFGCPLSGAPTDALKCENCDFPTSVISGHIGLIKVVSTPQNVAPAPSRLAPREHDEAAASTAHQAQQPQWTSLAEGGSRFCIRFGCPLSGAPTDALKCENCDFPTSVISGYIGLTKVVEVSGKLGELTHRQQLPSARVADPTRQGSAVRMTQQRSPRRRHTVAAVFYLVLTVAAVIAAFSNPRIWIAVILLAVYTTYLFRGGRWLVFFF